MQPMACVSFLLIESVMRRRCVRICVPFPGYIRSHQTEEQFCFNVLSLTHVWELNLTEQQSPCPRQNVSVFHHHMLLFLKLQIRNVLPPAWTASPQSQPTGHQTSQSVVLYQQQLWFSLTLDAEAPYFPLHLFYFLLCGCVCVWGGGGGWGAGGGGVNTRACANSSRWKGKSQGRKSTG